MPEMLIRIKAECDTEYDGSCGGTQMSHEIVTLDQLIKENNEYFFNCFGYAVINPKSGKIDKKTADVLRSHGWVHKDTIADREEKKLFEQEYYLLDEGNNYFGEPKYVKIDVDNLTDDQLQKIARSSKIAQAVDPKSVFSDSQNKKLQTKKNQIEEQKQKAKLSAEKKAAKKKAKEIEAAKKLLAEAGL
jgi:hypothetical protein